MNPGDYDDRTHRFDAPGPGDQYGQYPDGGYGDHPDAPVEKSGPSIDYARLIGSIAATALVAAIAGGLSAWIVTALFERFGNVWESGGNTPTMYAIYGAVAAVVAGLLWFLLTIGTPDPRGFFGWIVGLVIVAAIALPLLVTANLLDGVAAAVVHLFIGLPIYALTGSFVKASRA